MDTAFARTQPANPAPDLLVGVVLGWSCLLFFGYGILSTVDPLMIIFAALGALSVASAVFVTLGLSDPYTGRFKMPHKGFDEVLRASTADEEKDVRSD